MLKKIDMKIWKIIGIVFGIIILLILIALLINLMSKERLDYNGIENKMVEVSKDYYKDNEMFLPKIDGNSTEVSLDTLVKEDYMKDPSIYLNNKNISCIGRVTVTKNGDSYGYYPYLNCGSEYETTYLFNDIKKNVVTSSDGLYKMNQYSVLKSGEKKSAEVFVYRGENVNNYLLINDVKWRIVKIDGNGNIVIIYDGKDPNQDLYSVWDDRYNSDKDGNYGINDYNVSRAKENLRKIYDSMFLPKGLKSKLLSHDVCIGKRKEKDTTNNGSIECSKVVDNQYLSLLPVYDYLNASIDSKCKKINDLECSNYNYLNTYSSSWWFVTASKEKSHLVYKVSSDGATTSSASNSGRLRMVGVIDQKTIVSGGDGSLTDPYIVK